MAPASATLLISRAIRSTPLVDNKQPAQRIRGHGGRAAHFPLHVRGGDELSSPVLVTLVESSECLIAACYTVNHHSTT